MNIFVDTSDSFVVLIRKNMTRNPVTDYNYFHVTNHHYLFSSCYLINIEKMYSIIYSKCVFYHLKCIICVDVHLLLIHIYCIEANELHRYSTALRQFIIPVFCVKYTLQQKLFQIKFVLLN
jgi:hypothetical protein